MVAQLLQTALLGTEKNTFDLNILPEEIREYIRTRHENDAELQFLETVALSHYYQLAGKGTERFTDNGAGEVMEEVRQIAPAAVLSIFNKIDSAEHGWKETLLNQWMDALIAGTYIVHPELVVKLLYTGRPFGASSKEKIMQVTGRKGEWIVAHSPELNYKKRTLSEQTWEEGVFQDRKALFVSWRQTNPSLSIEKLRLIWPNESIVNKKSFLDLLAEHSVAGDLPFLETLYQNEFKYHAKEKKTEKGCRNVIAGILLSHEDSALYKKTAEQLSPYFVKEKGGVFGKLKRKETVSFTLPEDEDGFWNASTMEQVYGFEVKNIDIGLFDYPAQYWCALFIQVLPVSFWAAAFDGDLNRMLTYFINGEQFLRKEKAKNVPVLQGAFIEKAKRSSDLAKALVQRLDAAEGIELLSLLSLEDYEAFVMKHRYFGDEEVLRNGPVAEGASWSLSFSRSVIKEVYDLAQQSKAPPSLGHVLALHLHPGVSDELVKYQEKARETKAYVLWNKNIFEPVFLSLEIRTLIDSIKK